LPHLDGPVLNQRYADTWPTANARTQCQQMAPAHLFCWATEKYLPAALDLVAKWGFGYVLTMVWHKPGGFQPHDLPQYNCEFTIYARRGTPVFIDTKDFNVCNSWPRREHSRKSKEFYDLIRRVTAGSHIDIFAREQHEGFAQYGNEIAKFVESVDVDLGDNGGTP
jgi:N6-adenosine-specific RNA methylase IME4